MDDAALAVRLDGISHRYGARVALAGIALEIRTGATLALIGPDGVGKSTLLGLMAGARRIQAGRVRTLGGDMADVRHRLSVYPRIAYMPQGLGRNLYMDLSVVENLRFFGRLFGQDRPERERRIARLLEATGLAPFPDRAAGKLSGGMKQKLGLCCALVHDPDLLILDEPTTGVDPLSRRQFWSLIDGLRAVRPAMTVVVATAYMEEAERFDSLVAMNRGAVLATGTPEEIRRATRSATLEEAFVALLPEAERRDHAPVRLRPRTVGDGEPAIEAESLTRRFGAFTAVERVSFRIERGEIFGFLGSNGCGKTTTMKMLTGLLPPTSGTARLFGEPARAEDIATRRRVGYMSQGFSLYAELTVRQNLSLHGRLFHVPAAHLKTRMADLIERFGLADHADVLAQALPLGVRQRLSLAVAVIHEPELLILDEPTSGVDPVARDRFWNILIELSREGGVTIFVSTHFMNEAARCDRVTLMHAGRALAIGPPDRLIEARGVSSLEEAFIAYLSEAAGGTAGPAPMAGDPPLAAALSPAVHEDDPPARAAAFSLARLWAYALREGLELWRDRIRLAFALGGTALLMLVFGYGITFDVEDLRWAALDRDRTPESRTYLEGISGSRYFLEQPPLADTAEMDRRLRNGDIALAIELPPDFGRDVLRGRSPAVAVWIDGAMPFRAETIRGYVEGLHQNYLATRWREATQTGLAEPPAEVVARYRYNQAFESAYAMVPSTVAILLLFIPSILMALGVVREKELGSIANFYVTPVTRLEFLLGKQAPYVAVGMVNFLVLVTMSVAVFDVPIKGSFAALALGTLLYLLATTALGLLVSTFTRSQIAALFGTAIATTLPAVQFSGMMTPVASLEGSGALIGRLYPTTYYMKITVGTFTKALGFADVAPDLLALAAFPPVLLLAGVALLRSQER